MLKDYIVMITGATSGMGLETAKEFLSQGAKVIGIGRHFEKTKDLGEEFYPFTCDVTDENQIKAAIDYVKKEFGKLDTLICNAGSAINGDVENVTSEDLDRGFKLYYKQCVLFTKYAVPILRKSSNPSIAYTASVAGYVIGDSIPYYTMKAALVNYTRQAAAGLLNYKKGKDTFGNAKNTQGLAENDNTYIRVNAICPGLIRTSLLPDQVWNSLGQEEALKVIPSRRIGEAWEIGKLYAFLASDKATFITGAVIPIDGGWRTTHPRA